MKFLLWIGLAIVGLYLLLVIPAGIGVLVKERRFRKSPDRSVVLVIIRQYQQLLDDDESAVLQVIERGRRETVERNGVEYSIDITGKKMKAPRSYKIFVSVGRLQPITIGHVESLDVSFSQSS